MNIYKLARSSTIGSNKVVRHSLTVYVYLLLIGCGSFEPMITVPMQPEMAVINDYNTNRYRASIEPFTPFDMAERAEQFKLQDRADHLYLLVDLGEHMSGDYHGIGMKEYALDILYRFTTTAPDKSFSGASFLRMSDLDSGRSDVSIINPRRLAERLRAMNPKQKSGIPLLREQIAAFESQVNGKKGNVAVVLITTWPRLNSELADRLQHVQSNIQQARDAEDSDQQLCLYAIGIGNRLSRSKMERVDHCAESIAADKVIQAKDMARLVEKVFYAGPADSDDDGIYDYRDRCPDTPPHRIVDFNGCIQFSLNHGGAHGE